MDADNDTHPPVGQLVSQRGASSILGELGLSREMARRALRAGVAGQGVRLRSTVLHDEDRVRALLRPVLQAHELPPEMQRGTFLARAGDRLDLSRTGPDPVDRRRALSDGWRFSLGSRIALVLWLQRRGHLPLVATVSGFAVVGAEIVDAKSLGPGATERVRLILREPGAWYDAVHLRRLSAPPGGAWTMFPHDALPTTPSPTEPT